MPVEIAEILAIVAVITIVGLLLVSIPLTRRLGRALEVWIEMRAEGAADSTRVDQLDQEVRAIGRHMDALDDRLAMLADRVDFFDSLTDTKTERATLPPGSRRSSGDITGSGR